MLFHENEIVMLETKNCIVSGKKTHQLIQPKPHWLDFGSNFILKLNWMTFSLKIK